MEKIINHPTACCGTIRNDQHDSSRYYNNGDIVSNYFAFCRDAAEFILQYGLPSTMRICLMHNGQVIADGSSSTHISQQERKMSLADYMRQHPAKYQSK